MEKLKKQNLFFIFMFFLIFLFVLSKKGSGIHFPDYGDLHKFDPHREGGHLLPNLDLLVQGEKVGSGVRFITNSKGIRNEREFDF